MGISTQWDTGASTLFAFAWILYQEGISKICRTRQSSQKSRFLKRYARSFFLSIPSLTTPSALATRIKNIFLIYICLGLLLNQSNQQNQRQLLPYFLFPLQQPLGDPRPLKQRRQRPQPYRRIGPPPLAPAQRPGLPLPCAGARATPPHHARGAGGPQHRPLRQRAARGLLRAGRRTAAGPDVVAQHVEIEARFGAPVTAGGGGRP